MNDYIIIANGEFLVREIIVEAIQNKTIVALDGAANKLSLLGITPQVILGDFDSIQEAPSFGIQKTFAELAEDDEPYPGKNGILIVPMHDQLNTDLTKAIRFCVSHGAASITIICAAGGRIDHFLGNLMILQQEYNPATPIVLHTEQQSLRYIQNETLTMCGEIGDMCGIFPSAQSRFTTSGLNYDVVATCTMNTCNSLARKEAQVMVNGGALIAMPPLLDSQRAFMAMSASEQLKMRLRDMK